jgi:hypothetical protein
MLNYIFSLTNTIYLAICIEYINTKLLFILHLYIVIIKAINV